MTTEDASKKTSRAQLVKLDRGFKLAEQWVNNMGKSLDDDKSNAAILEGRPPRLGIGATVPRGPTYVRSDDPIERKLRGTLNLNAKERKVDIKAAADRKVEEKGDTDDEESESKTKAFTKKRLSPPTFVDRKKKQK